MKFLNINRNVAFKQMPDGGVEYTGDSIPELGIEKGDAMDKVVSTLIAEVMSLRSTSDGMKITEKVDQVADKVNNLTVDDLKTSAATFSVGSTTSVSSSRIVNKEFTYSTAVEDKQFRVNYDMSNIIYSMPKDYKVIGGSLKVQGNNKNATLVGSTAGTVGSIAVPSSSIPANLNFSLRVKTPDGDVELARTISVQSLQEVSAGSTLAVRDLTAPTSSDLTQKQYNESIAGEVSILKQELNEIKNLSPQTFESRLAALEQKLNSA